jgi:hypothetical protein
MWRWVTRGLILTFVSLLSLAAFAQGSQPTSFLGELNLPDPGVTQSGMVLVKGWAYDTRQVDRVELYVDDVFQQKANMGLPRIDVAESHPEYPGLQNAAPGFQTGFTANRFPNGNHTVYVKVYLTDGNVVEVGRRTVTIDNSINQAPFGFIDIPDPAGIYNASSSFPVTGWTTDTDGIKRVDVYIDDLEYQGAMYGDPRPDVNNTFPDFPASLFSGFIANVDTTRIRDGVHLLTIRATDNLGLSRTIGTRQIQVFNAENIDKPFGMLDEPKRDAVLVGTLCTHTPPPVISPASNEGAHITPVRGWALDLAPRTDTGRVAYVEMMIDGVRWASTDDCGFNPLFAEYANCYGLTRYDVERYYPNFPDAPRSGFMFTLDVGALMALGVRPGNHVLKVRVGDQQQTFSELPTRDGIPVFFQCAGDTNSLPAYGFIDIPTSFDYVKGVVVFQGWAIGEGGVSVVELFVDGNFVGTAQYGLPRPDVREQYPFINNSGNTGWRFSFDTAKLSNARHRLTARITAPNGRKTEIGSVDFYTQNAR